MPKIYTARKPVLLAAAFVVPMILWLALPKPDRASGKLQVTFLDVGQGQCILIETPTSQEVLIDGGGAGDVARADSTDVGLRTVVPYLHYRGITHLALVILTAPKADHCGGLASVLREESVGAILEGPNPPQSFADFRALGQEIALRKIPIVRADTGMQIELGRSVSLDVLNPPVSAPQASAVDPQSVDNLSVILRVNYGTTHFLLTSDATPTTERALLTDKLPLASDVLQIAHGGSPDPALGQWLAAVHPKFAVVSCSANDSPSGPNPSTLATLAARHIHLYTTAANGAVVFLSDGKTLTVLPTLGGASTVTR